MKRTMRYIICFFIIAALVAALWLIPFSSPAINQNKGIVVIDPGHGGFDGGATGRLTNVKEDMLNLSVSKKLKNMFENNGYTVIMTREDENAVGRTKDDDMQKRREIIDTSGADLVISVHMNKFSDTTCTGPVVFYHEDSEEGEKLAKAIQEEMVAALKPDRPRVHKPETYYILRSGTCPCVLVECGFISNEREEQLLQTDEYQNLCAAAIFKGAAFYMAKRSEPDKEENPPVPLISQ